MIGQIEPNPSESCQGHVISQSKALSRATVYSALDVKTVTERRKKKTCSVVFSLIHVLLLTEKFSEMKDEIPQAVIDSHVKNAASARAEKVKQETSEENTGTLNKIQLSE